MSLINHEENCRARCCRGVVSSSQILCDDSTELGFAAFPGTLALPWHRALLSRFSISVRHTDLASVERKLICFKKVITFVRRICTSTYSSFFSVWSGNSEIVFSIPRQSPCHFNCEGKKICTCTNFTSVNFFFKHPVYHKHTNTICREYTILYLTFNDNTHAYIHTYTPHYFTYRRHVACGCTAI